MSRPPEILHFYEKSANDVLKRIEDYCRGYDVYVDHQKEGSQLQHLSVNVHREAKAGDWFMESAELIIKAQADGDMHLKSDHYHRVEVHLLPQRIDFWFEDKSPSRHWPHNSKDKRHRMCSLVLVAPKRTNMEKFEPNEKNIRHLLRVLNEKFADRKINLNGNSTYVAGKFTVEMTENEDEWVIKNRDKSTGQVMLILKLKTKFDIEHHSSDGSLRLHRYPTNASEPRTFTFTLLEGHEKLVQEIKGKDFEKVEVFFPEQRGIHIVGFRESAPEAMIDVHLKTLADERTLYVINLIQMCDRPHQRYDCTNLQDVLDWFEKNL